MDTLLAMTDLAHELVSLVPGFKLPICLRRDVALLLRQLRPLVIVFVCAEERVESEHMGTGCVAPVQELDKRAVGSPVPRGLMWKHVAREIVKNQFDFR